MARTKLAATALNVMADAPVPAIFIISLAADALVQNVIVPAPEVSHR